MHNLNFRGGFNKGQQYSLNRKIVRVPRQTVRTTNDNLEKSVLANLHCCTTMDDHETSTRQIKINS